MNSNIQYIEDTYLLEATFKSLGFSEHAVLQKQAFDLSSTLGSISSSIQSFVGSQIQGQDASGIGRTILNFLAPAVFFRLHPILGLILTGAQLFGFDIISIFQKIVETISPKIAAGQQVTADEVNGAAKGMVAAASNDFLSPLRDLHKQGYFKQVEAQSFFSNLGKSWGDVAFVPPKTAHPLLRMFSFLGPKSRGGLMAGIIVWFVKTILLSAGLLAGGAAIAGALGAKPPGQEAASSSSSSSAPASQTPSGAGAMGLRQMNSSINSYNYKPKAGDIWAEPLGDQQPYERILQWFLETYPQLNQYTDIILNTPAFWNAVRAVSRDYRPGNSQLEIPDPFKTRNDVLSLFTKDVLGNITYHTGQ